MAGSVLERHKRLKVRVNHHEILTGNLYQGKLNGKWAWLGLNEALHLFFSLLLTLCVEFI
ncbi:hypothetical protein HanLR1_Chr01g0003411 [Helianthus annuus]|nr:hypothetical protein HanHA89_Chr01g0004071 [Helianthus annuus]KAJ0782024.1 hypothetical protein HanLR1_Chr01g0003411 [Helianthus annuus]